ncbi:MarR family transcriptional regulator [Pendulispora brunnea]|uniref:MarR family transcriptional regulator n=1 Tax=Pendulispora brunnea TaxID=2905690 RepID=A0ABZ2KJK4_9BACT
MTKAKRDLVGALAATCGERFPEWDTEALILSMRLGHIARQQQARCEEISDRHGMGPAGFLTMALLATAPEGEGLTPGDLMDCMDCPSGTVTHRLNLLERAGLLRRQVDPADRRSFRLHITPLGLEKLEASAGEYFAALREPFGKLTRAERQTLEALLRKAGGGLKCQPT